MFVYELNGCGFESRCSDQNSLFRVLRTLEVTIVTMIERFSEV